MTGKSNKCFSFLVCRDECELLEDNICRMEYSIAKRHPVIGRANILPDCKKLPERNSPDGLNCLGLGIPLPTIIQLDEGTLVPLARALLTLQCCEVLRRTK